MANYKRGYDKRRGSFCKMCKFGKRLGNNKVNKENVSHAHQYLKQAQTVKEQCENLK